MAETVTGTMDTDILAIGASLAQEILTRRQTRLEREAHKPPFKPRRHYASALNGCARQLVYAQTHWKEKEPFTAKGMAAMQDGQHEERLLIQELMTDGFDVVEQQVQLDDDRYFVTGKIDGKLKWQGRRVPFEVKRLQPFAYDRIQSVQDFYDDPFALKNLRQLTLYLLLHAEPLGLMILSNGLGARNVIPVPLDYQLGEAILHDLDTANAALQRRLDQLKANTEVDYLPPRIPYSAKVCGWCSYKNICLPDQHAGDGAQVADTELADKIAEYATLKPAVAKAEALKKVIKTALEGKEIVLAGNYIVTGKWQERAVKAQGARTDRWWAWEAEKLTNDPSESV